MAARRRMSYLEIAIASIHYCQTCNEFALDPLPDIRQQSVWLFPAIIVVSGQISQKNLLLI
jgi:hypothetical protein